MYIKDTRLMSVDDMKRWKSLWPNFSPSELDSDDWSLVLSTRALIALQAVRDSLNKPMRITCAYRNPAHNKRVGGSPNSQHLKGTAFDIVVPDMDYARELERIAIDEGFTAIGRYPARHFIHIDMRPRKPSGGLYRWGKAWT